MFLLLLIAVLYPTGAEKQAGAWVHGLAGKLIGWAPAEAW